MSNHDFLSNYGPDLATAIATALTPQEEPWPPRPTATTALNDTEGGDEMTTRLVYTVREAADELRIGYSTARERIRRGELRSFKDGSRRLIAGEDLIAYVRARQGESDHG